MPISLIYLVLYGFVFFVGSCFGSFVNVIVYRMPRDISIVRGRSFCPTCGKKIPFYDKIPLLSYLWLWGKCRKCRAPIAKRYLFSEIVGGLLALISVLTFGFDFKAIDIFIILIILLAIALIDYDTMTIPNKLIIALAVPVAASYFVFLTPDLQTRLLGMIVVALPLFLVNLIKKDSFGGGDIKLCFVMGFLLGVSGIIVGAIIGIILGGFAGLIQMKNNPELKHMAFGPYLCIGMTLAFFFGDWITNYYLTLIQ